MDRLKLFYMTWTKAWAAAVAIISFFLIELISGGVSQPWLKWLVDKIGSERMVVFLGSSTFIASLYLIGELVIRHKAWRLPFVHKNLDISGKWHGETFYQSLEQPTKQITLTKFEPSSEYHVVHIKQDALGISIENTGGNVIAKWKSETATINSDFEFIYLYDVTYTGSSNFTGKRRGFEALAPIVFTDGSARSGHAMILSGEFGHCVGDAKPTYRGNTVFIRDIYKHLVTVDALPGNARKGKLADKISKGEWNAPAPNWWQLGYWFGPSETTWQK